jgi:hypothetical protein
MRRFSIATAMAICMAFFGALTAPAANAHGDHRNDNGKIVICKRVKGDYGSEKRFRFHIVDSKGYYKSVRVRSGGCEKIKVKKGWYKVTEAKKDGWKLKDIKGEYNRKDVGERWATVRVHKHDTDVVIFINKKKHRESPQNSG